MRAAVLEDHRLVRESLVHLLSEGGVEVTVASDDAAEFMASVTHDPPTVALIDLTLQKRPGAADLDGLGVLRLLREQRSPARAVVLSASTGPEQVATAYDEGAAGYLFKLTASGPYLLDTLRAVERGTRVFPFEAFESLQQAPASPPPPSSLHLSRLTAREREVLARISAGDDNLKIAALLGISERTVKTHVSSLYRKLQVENRVQLALVARQLRV